ncbi:MAG: B12-binding domain-containing radical SAM protein [Acidobacteriota bacterium]
MKHRVDQLRVMLIQPPVRTYKRYTPPILAFMDRMMSQLNLALPIGLLQVGACVRDLCDLKLLDCIVGETTDLESPDGTYTTFGLPDDEIRRRLLDFAPDVVGIGSQFAPQEAESLRMAHLVKEVHPEAQIVLGGANASVRYDSLIQDPACDYCVVGEGEITFREFLQCLAEGRSTSDILGLVSKEWQLRQRPYIKDLDTIPIPAYDLADESYFTEGKMPVITSRGCPFRCTFCSIHLHMGKKFRFNSVDYVRRHLEYCINKLGVNWFSFEDDNISLRADRWDALLDMLIEADFDIEWFTRNGVRADTLNTELLEKMKASGCVGVIYAVESGNSRVLNEVIKKKTSLTKISQVMCDTHQLGIPMSGFYVVGFPGETLAEIRDTLEFALGHFERYGVYPFLFFATPLVGTELYDQCQKLGIVQNGDMISPRDWALATNHFGKRMITTNDFSARDLAELELEFTTRVAEIFVARHLGKWNVAGLPSKLAGKYFSRRLKAQTTEYVASAPRHLANVQPAST